MDANGHIEKIVTPTLDGMGYELVRVRMTGGDRQILQIMAERTDGAAMTVEDCALISTAVSAVLDVEDPIQSAYSLEVSSPGIDRPLTRPRDFERFAGFEAKVDMYEMTGGRKRFRGRILGLTDDRLRLATKEGEVELPVGGIQRAKLLMTDELLAAAAQR
jgi:ribosome maturation factor RimP